MKQARLALGNVTTSAAPIDSGFPGGSGVDGLLDFGFLSRGVTAIDVTRGWLVLEPLDVSMSELPARARPQ